MMFLKDQFLVPYCSLFTSEVLIHNALPLLFGDDTCVMLLIQVLFIFSLTL